tara:strand:- start:699 stop:2636 length:1938 start_codon:yes stop_codon:yes gene_type:complete
VADYRVNLELAIKGAKDLQKTRLETKRLQKEIDIFNKRVRQAFPASVKNFNNLSKELGRTRKAVNEAAIGTDHYRVAIKNAVKVEEQFNKQLSNKEKLFRIERLSYKEGISFSEAKSRIIQQEIKAENELARAKLRRSGIDAGIRRGIGGAVGSGIIGGGFPLLFGQGPVSALGGAAGGIAGGALSAIPGMGQFGFALSIAGTAIGSAMEDLTQALRKPEENIDNLIGKLGLIGTPTEKMAKELEKMGLKGSAAKLVLDEFNKKFGNTPDILKENSEKMLEFQNKINQLGTAITLFLGKALVPFIDSIMSGMTQGKLLQSLNAQEGKNFSKAQQSIINQSQLEAQKIFQTTNQGKDIGKTFAQILDERITFNLKKAVGSPDSIPKLLSGTPQGSSSPSQTQAFIDQAKFEQQILPLQQALEIEEKRLNTSDEKLQLMQEEFKLTNLQNDLERLKLDNKGTENNLHDDAINKLEAQVNLQKKVVDNAKALVDPMRQVSNIMAQDMGNALKGLIQGTQTLNEALRNVLNNMANSFLNLGIFGNVAGTFIPGEGLLGSLFKANGGPVKGGNSYIVGERGPELFTPGVSGMVTPNHALGGSTNVVVNVDAKGNRQVEGDDNNATILGNAIAAAVQQELVKQQMDGGLLS